MRRRSRRFGNGFSNLRSKVEPPSDPPCSFGFPFEPPPLNVVPAPSLLTAPQQPLPQQPPAVSPPPKDAPLQQNAQSTLVLGRKPISAASLVRRARSRLRLRPIGSVQDILRVTPGLVVVQHSGGGKANQYFLRGFDADHGTDLALSIDGIPINMVSHAHGQGFSDTNFIIPETVERVEITEGPLLREPGRLRDRGLP